VTKRFFSVLFACCLVSASAEAGNVRLLKNTPKGCQSAGLVRAYIENELPIFNPKYILGAELFAELKTKAAKLGANRIVVRDAINEKNITYHRGLHTQTWRASTYVAEAFRCGGAR